MGGLKKDFLQPALGVVLGLFGAVYSSHAYTFTRADNGSTVRWPTLESSPNQAIYLAFGGNPSNRSGLNSLSVYQMVVRSLQVWKEAAGETVTFDYWQGDETETYIPNSDLNGTSSIYFTSGKSDSAEALGSNIIGLTQMWYEVDSGVLKETDIALNDVNFVFTSSPSDTTGSGSGVTTGNRVYIGNVITHEMGHALGLSHSGSAQSTMLANEAPDQAHLGCDDISAIRNLYPGSKNDGTGRLTGRILASQGQGFFGAQVSVISLARGAVISARLTESDGSFQFDAIEPAPYAVMVEPFFPGANSLSNFYSQIQTGCGSGTFGRFFIRDGSSSDLGIFNVSEGNTVTIPDTAMTCSSGGAQVAGPQGGSSVGSAHLLEFESNTAAVVDRGTSSSSTLYYRVSGVNGELHIRTSGFSLYAPVKTQLTLMESNGAVVGQSTQPSYTSESGYKNYDSRLDVAGLDASSYIVRVQLSPSSPALVPMGTSSMDSVPYFVLSVNRGPQSLAKAGDLPDSAKCRLPESFPNYVSPPGGPQLDPEKQEGYGFLGFCGTLRGLGDGNPPPPSGGQLVGWFAPWILLLLMAAHRRLPRPRFHRYATGLTS